MELIYIVKCEGDNFSITDRMFKNRDDAINYAQKEYKKSLKNAEKKTKQDGRWHEPDRFNVYEENIY